MNKKSNEFYTKELSKYKESIEKDLKVHFELPDCINRYKINTKSMIVLTNQGSDLLKMEEPIFFIIRMLISHMKVNLYKWTMV